MEFLLCTHATVHGISNSELFAFNFIWFLDTTAGFAPIAAAAAAAAAAAVAAAFGFGAAPMLVEMQSAHL